MYNTPTGKEKAVFEGGGGEVEGMKQSDRQRRRVLKKPP
jgi:hypothetical protein